MAKGSAAETERARVRETERAREIRMQSWSQARNEGIREGLLMAIGAANSPALFGARNPGDAIRARGDRHFGDSEWQAQRRPG